MWKHGTLWLLDANLNWYDAFELSILTNNVGQS